jgi:hypothetical protein
MFIVTWAAAMVIWRFGRIEEKWTARLHSVRLQAGEGAQAALSPPLAEASE